MPRKPAHNRKTSNGSSSASTLDFAIETFGLHVQLHWLLNLLRLQKPKPRADGVPHGSRHAA